MGLYPRTTRTSLAAAGRICRDDMGDHLMFIADADIILCPSRTRSCISRTGVQTALDIAVILQQKKDLADRVAALHKKQKEMQKIADMFGVEWREREKERREGSGGCAHTQCSAR